MNPLVLKKEVLHEMVYHLLTRIISDIPRDVEDYLEKQLASEKAPLASLQLKNTLENIHYARDNSALSCGDTGYPLFYIYLGGNILFEGGPHILYEVCQDVVAKATKESRLRSTMVHPLTRVNVGTNVGSFMPYIDIRMDPKLVGLKVIFVPKGGGAEIYGSFFRMLLPMDGKNGVIKFILDSVMEGLYAGKVCPPCIVGIGIGGTSDLCMKLAKEAAVLRPVGDRHPEKEIAALEVELLDSINSLGFGAMGCGGKSAVMDVHIEYALVHTGALPVAVNIQCVIARRGIAEIDGNGNVQFSMF